MKANETNLEELLEGKKQYLVPLYQRTYSWKQGNLQQLWEDIRQLVEHRQDQPHASHFIGSMVFAPTTDPGPTGVKQYVIVDGQQRLTTLTLLLAAIRDHRAQTEDASHRDRLNEDYLVVKWSEGQPTKLLPTQADRESYLACIYGTANAGAADDIGATYLFFRRNLLAVDDPEDRQDIQRIEEAVLRGLAIVSITSDAGDNVHRIFESLNNTGLKLSQADLLRNYIFMRLTTRGEAVYRDLWFPLQQRLTPEELELLFWIDLTQGQPTAQQSEVYQLQQQRLDKMPTEAEIEREVERLAAVGELLRIARHPENENDQAVRRELVRLESWGSVTAYPLIVHLLHRRSIGEADNAQTAQALRYMLSFFIRRMLIGQATKNMNRILLAAVPAIDDKAAVDAALRQYFSTGRKAWATDAQLRVAALTANVYWSGRAAQKQLLFRWLEDTYGSNEPVMPEKLSIEHIAPQTVTDDWRTEIAQTLQSDEDVDAVYQRLLHTLGNLTITGYNPHMSNRPFAEKRTWFHASGLLMNHEIAAKEHWTREEIHSRASALVDRIIGQWPGPDPAVVEVGEESINPLWTRMAEALLAIPTGAWTSYGDLAALLGTHRVPLGTRLANHVAPNAYRVLRVDGTISPDFRWTSEAHDEDPRDLLTTEGVRFDEQGHADQNQRLSTADLAHLLGLDASEIIGELSDPQPGNAIDLRDKFLQQLSKRQDESTVHGTLELLRWWSEVGGQLEYGTAEETSCFLMARNANHALGTIWPLALYPNGKAEVVFQHMASRMPFDEIAMRKEFMRRLNEAPGVDLPEAKINLRPGFPISALANPLARTSVQDALAWFYVQATSD